MREGWIITIITEDHRDKQHRVSFIEYGGIYDCTRLINRHKAKRGHEIVGYKIERVKTLV